MEAFENCAKGNQEEAVLDKNIQFPVWRMLPNTLKTLYTLIAADWGSGEPEYWS